MTFRITGEGDVLRAIHAMVPAHARELDKIGTWRVRAETTPGRCGPAGQARTVRTKCRKIEALGFFGLMATGSTTSRIIWQWPKVK
jgi:hypothetical protein